MKTISLCIITKNEEKKLQRFLGKTNNFFHELVLIDTGSTDGTINLAKNLGFQVYEYQWDNSFSNVRNFGLEKCSKDFVFFLDADEEILNPEQINETLDRIHSDIGGIFVNFESIIETNQGTQKYLEKLPRIIKNAPQIKYKYRVHEQVIHSINDSNLKIVDSELRVRHHGYNITRDDFQKKIERNLSLLNLELEENPNDELMLYHRSKSYSSIGESALAKRDIIKALQLNKDESFFKMKLLNQASKLFTDSKDLKQAFDYAYSSLQLNANQVYPYLLISEIATKNFDYLGGVNSLNSAENNIKENHEISRIIGDYHPPLEHIKFLKGKLYLKLEKFSMAKIEFEAGIEINPNYVDNYVGLGNALFKLGEKDSALNILKKAIEISPNNKQIIEYISKLENKQKSTQKNVISLCMIVKNEEKNLAGAIESVRNLVSEVIVVDTGSSDKTKAIAESLSAKVYDFPWNESFSDARNESIKHATKDWILYLDADERINEKWHYTINNLLKNVTDDIGGIALTIESDHLKLDGSTEKHRGVYPRLFRNYGYPKIKFKGRVHEQITPSLFELDKSIITTEAVIEHLGYNLTREEMERKVQRNYRMLLKHVNEEPTNGYAWFQLGQTLGQMKLTKEAEDAIRFAIKCGNLSDPIYASAAATLAQMTGNQKKFEEALEWSKKSLEKAPDQLFALHINAFALMYLKRYEESEKVFLETIEKIKNKPKIPQAGFDIDVPLELMEQGLAKLRSMK